MEYLGDIGGIPDLLFQIAFFILGGFLTFNTSIEIMRKLYVHKDHTENNGSEHSHDSFDPDQSMDIIKKPHSGHDHHHEGGEDNHHPDEVDIKISSNKKDENGKQTSHIDLSFRVLFCQKLVLYFCGSYKCVKRFCFGRSNYMNIVSK